ncbi:hypothetical protein EN933_08470 [Mesorhizobium sp. M7A.F.Ca.US.001.01.1.1]|nr:hypothetical protein EN933_08470 [Mesorhizobium sp. M7A.F.Ca.US.001.01.1.1]
MSVRCSILSGIEGGGAVGSGSRPYDSSLQQAGAKRLLFFAYRGKLTRSATDQVDAVLRVDSAT